MCDYNTLGGGSAIPSEHDMADYRAGQVKMHGRTFSVDHENFDKDEATFTKEGECESCGGDIKVCFRHNQIKRDTIGATYEYEAAAKFCTECDFRSP